MYGHCRRLRIRRRPGDDLVGVSRQVVDRSQVGSRVFVTVGRAFGLWVPKTSRSGPPKRSGCPSLGLTARWLWQASALNGVADSHPVGPGLLDVGRVRLLPLALLQPAKAPVPEAPEGLTEPVMDDRVAPGHRGRLSPTGTRWTPSTTAMTTCETEGTSGESSPMRLTRPPDGCPGRSVGIKPRRVMKLNHVQVVLRFEDVAVLRLLVYYNEPVALGCGVAVSTCCQPACG